MECLAEFSETSVPMLLITRGYMPEDPNQVLAPFVLIKIGNTILWYETPWNFVDGYKPLGGISYLHLKFRTFCPENGGNRFLPDVSTLCIHLPSNIAFYLMLGYCGTNLSEFNKIKKNVMGGTRGTYV